MMFITARESKQVQICMTQILTLVLEIWIQVLTFVQQMFYSLSHLSRLYLQFIDEEKEIQRAPVTVTD